ncbi:hypothetical protein MCOR27_008814 [Pyricularia oryzae]|uniref:Uncharacterized protein n=1 Tax=Pyricularia grisea TaxID=148305 RepID=A0ABQ8NUW5_PYRGI|nr:hypothetical protein MCOR01_002064 [Pyricularia oryzae]KAI6302212.1 hypothetical protein MCOR33_002392 [Pyricularia grisea]KAH9429349.1 hypothetical protein MCOR02_010753 [Pyricularia oryzae]KAI6263791.1 hypothetical protein MCOR19_000121 [Pyricularia oryzae]KAI6271478.1 hypothetical protein MCOR27_008814 [Pyricularia oryzae]
MAATSEPFTGTSLPFKPQIPITPPPDCLNFAIKCPELSTKSTPLSREAPAAMDPKIKTAKPHIETPATSVTPSTDSTQSSSASSQSPNLDSSSSTTPTNANTTSPTPSMDPRHLALISRIAAYYQQRSQAIANYQHQKCQAWANLQRAKCQEMTQAAMLVVAWYVRDRIQRRRKREKRQFRRGLSERSAATAPTPAGVGKKKRVEATVDKWIGHVPKDVLPSPNTAALDKPIDTDELGFSIDAEPSPTDGDDKLFAVADGMIKSQLARIEVPLLGALDFAADDDNSDSESDFEEVRRWRPGGEDDGDLERAAEQDDDDEDDYSYEYDDDDDDDDMEDLTGEVVSN